MDLHTLWFEKIDITRSYYDRQIPRWFMGKDPRLDEILRLNFAPKLERLLPEVNSPRELLSQILLLDQVPRNSFRNSPRAYAYDHLARKLALSALGTEMEAGLSLPERIFLYLPFQHAEDKHLQDLSVEKFFELHRLAPKEIRSWTQLGVDKAIGHRKTILEFGRFPWRA